MKSIGRRLSQAIRKAKPSRTRSNRSKLYVAIPPKDGWPRFTGDNWGALGLRQRSGK